MLKRHFLLTLRNLRRNPLYTAIVIGGLSLGITTFLAILQWTSWHAGFDRYIPEGENIYRLTLHEQNDNFERHTARIIHGDVVHQLFNDVEIPELLGLSRLAPYRNAIVRNDNVVFYEDKSFACDPEFIRFFQPEMLIGDIESAIDAPFKVILSDLTAKKYFGDENPVGKTIEISHQFAVKPETYEITGVFKNIRKDTHFNIELLTSFEDPVAYSGTAWVYFKLTDNADLSKVEEEIRAFIVANNEEEYSRGIVPVLMPIFDIHMKSHLARELEQNVHMQTIFILFIAGLLVFVLAWFNFTLLAISQNQLNLNKLIYQWQLGSGKKLFFFQFFTDFFTIGLISFIVAILISLLVNTPIDNTFGVSILHNVKLFFAGALGIFLVLLVSTIITAFYATQKLYLILKKRYFASRNNSYNSISSKNWFIKAVIITEFIITFVLISNLLMIREQVNFSINQQIGSNDSTTIQIPELPRPILNKYPVFRDELEKYPVFEGLTAMMVEPGGETMDAFAFALEGLPVTENRLFLFPVDENFIRFYNLEILAGKDFPLTYNLNDTTEYYILNETAARIYDTVSYEDLLNRELKLDASIPGYIFPGNIIGIVKDFHLSNMNQEIQPMVIFPEYTWLYNFSIRFKGDPKPALKILQEEWKEFFPEYPLRYHFTTELYRGLYQSQLTEINVLIVFGILSLLIAGTGLFALSGFFMQQKLHAAAIRKINGAKLRQILFPELLQYLKLALIASVIALPLSWLSVNKWISNFTYQAEMNYWIYLGIGLFLVLFSWLSVFYHALRLARINPTDFIRGE